MLAMVGGYGKLCTWKTPVQSPDATIQPDRHNMSSARLVLGS